MNMYSHVWWSLWHVFTICRCLGAHVASILCHCHGMKSIPIDLLEIRICFRSHCQTLVYSLAYWFHLSSTGDLPESLEIFSFPIMFFCKPDGVWLKYNPKTSLSEPVDLKIYIEWFYKRISLLSYDTYLVFIMKE